MKPTTFLISVGLVLLTGLASCSKYLDQNPVSTPTDATTWQSDADANSAVAACYSLIRSALDASVSYYVYGDLPTDYWSTIQDGDFQNINQLNWGISVPAANVWDPKLKLRVYTPFYAAIQQSNRCLYFLNRMPVNVFNGNTTADQVAQRNSYLGEAYFTRAFNYFYMARVWGDVPLDTSYQSDISTFKGIARSPQQAVLAACVSDLAMARQYLGWQNPSSASRVVRADKGAVFALLAHLYAWRGDYDSCSMVCDSVINSGSYSLIPGASYPTIYSGQSAESIFEIAQNTATESMNALAYSASIANYTLCAPLLPNIPIPNWQINSTVLGKLYYDTNDLRYKKEFTVVNSGSQNFYSCIKYSNIQTLPTTNSGNYYLLLNNIIIFRLADILLLKAEALTSKKTSDLGGALILINQVRERAGAADMPPVANRLSLIDSVTAERGRELFLEGHRFYDLIRNDRLTGVSQFPQMTQSGINAGEYYWPLDPSLFVLNPSLTQTAYWTQILRN
ncbi:RagB/SusD family nutrient uptake outer membrane protein [Puia dinghuensis]|uniref:Starch-binding protein n=1 Tax=Puia dinghuensis TaxID=1792502 RepID=A0A8J2XW24_9BACT|nr:RagB/SusD family nutrient uptake outer membrane protein [Puia dinghuensis]GGB20602.1 starch-binding protein [Puia dinghuensis]